MIPYRGHGNLKRVYTVFVLSRGRAVVCGCGQDGAATTTEIRGGVECRGRGGVPGVSSGAIVPWSRNYIHHNNHHNWDNNAPGPQ